MIDMPDPALLFVFDVLAAIPVAGVGWFVGRRGRARDIAAARARQAEAETALEHAVKARLKAEGDLAPLQDTLHRTDAALSASGAHNERLQHDVEWLATERAQAVIARQRADLDARIVLDTLAASYVRVGPAFKRWRADGVYGEAQAAEQVQAEAQQATGASQDVLEGPVAVPASLCTGQGASEASGGPQIEPLRVKMDAEVLADFHEGARLFGVDVRVTPATSFPVHAIGDDGPGVRVGEGA